MHKTYITLLTTAVALGTATASFAFAGNTCDTANLVSGSVIDGNDERAHFSLLAGETLTLHTTTPDVLWVFGKSSIGVRPSCGPDTTSCDGYQMTADEDGFITIVLNNYQANPPEQMGSSPATGPVYDPADYSFSCSAGVSGADSTSQIEGNAQGMAFGDGLNGQARSRNGGSNSVSRDALFLSTSNMGDDTGWSFWLQASVRQYDGDYEGNGMNFVFGADTELGSGTYVGGLVGIGNLDLDSTTSPATYSSDSLSAGAYFITQLGGNLGLRGYAAYGRPEVNADGATFTADRLMYGLTLDGSYGNGPVMWTPFVSLLGFEEDQPAYDGNGGPVAAHTVSSITASLGLRIDFETQIGGSPAYPYLSIAGDFSRFNDGLGTVDEFQSARYGAGIVIEGDTGTFSFDINKGNVTSGTQDLGFSLNWRSEF